LVLDIVDNDKMIDIFDMKNEYQDSITNEIIYEVEADTKLMLECFPEVIKKGSNNVPGEILINGLEYCTPRIGSIYASLRISQDRDANCLFNIRDYTFLKYKYGIYNQLVSNVNRINAFAEVFNLYLPNELVLHDYASESDERCGKCSRYSRCKDTYLKDIEDNTQKVLGWRNYDEIIQAKEEIEKIINMKNKIDTFIDPIEIKNEFCKKQEQINKKINRVFPKIQRWTNLVTIFGIPATIFSAATANVPSTIVSAGVTGAAKAVDEYIKYYKNKNSWVGFLNHLQDRQKNNISTP
jgi:hypothetical protein